MDWNTIKSTLGAPREIYRTQKSILAVGLYFARLLARRGPSALRRRIETRQSLAQIARRTAAPQDRINVAALVQGAVGDDVIAARFLRDLNACCRNIVIDVYAANVKTAEWIYNEVPGLGNCFQDTAFRDTSKQYDASLVFEDILRVGACKASMEAGRSGSLSALLGSINRFHEQHKASADTRYNRDGILAQELVYNHNTG